MLMIDRVDGEPSHTTWVIKPAIPSTIDADAVPIQLETGEVDDEIPETPAPGFATQQGADSVFVPTPGPALLSVSASGIPALPLSNYPSLPMSVTVSTHDRVSLPPPPDQVTQHDKRTSQL